jgi:hypothetical protein
MVQFNLPKNSKITDGKIQTTIPIFGGAYSLTMTTKSEEPCRATASNQNSPQPLHEMTAA